MAKDLEMIKEKVEKEDERYLIYYHFKAREEAKESE